MIFIKNNEILLHNEVLTVSDWRSAFQERTFEVSQGELFKKYICEVIQDLILSKVIKIMIPSNKHFLYHKNQIGQGVLVFPLLFHGLQ